MDQMSRFIGMAHDFGCPKEQVLLFLQGGYIPQPKQLQFHAACREADYGEATEIGFGGARGPGKTHAMLCQIGLDDCQRVPGLKALVLRKVGKAIRETFDDMRLRLFGRLSHDYNKSSGVLTFSNGSRIVLGHFKNESDIDGYLGLEYDVIGVEEATTLTVSKYRSIKTTLRTSKRNWIPRIYTTTNPGGIGHAWYKDRFIMPWRSDTEGATRFIPATVGDNMFINKGYRKTLEDLRGWKKRAWLYGDWDISAGQFFTNLNFDRHVVDSFAIPDHWPRVWAGLDYGWTHPTAFVLLAQNHEGITFVCADYAKSQELPTTHGTHLTQALAASGIEVNRLVTVEGGGDMWQPDKEGNTVAEDYERFFPMLNRANMDRVGGAALILKMLGDATHTPTLKFMRSARRTYQQLAQLLHDPNRPEDVLKVDADEEGVGGDDLYDALRYGLMGLEEQQQVRMTTLRY
jgi:PBSX family phage terminase large subunit